MEVGNPSGYLNRGVHEMNRKNTVPFSFKVDYNDFGKSSWSKNNPKTCVLVAVKPEGVALRDSKDKSGITLFFTKDEWGAFLKGAQAGEFGEA